MFREIEALKDKIAPGTYECAKALRREECAHKAGTSPAVCIADMLGAENEGKLLLATQDEALKGRVRMVPGVPLLGYYKGVLTLEEPTDLSYKLAKQVNSQVAGRKQIHRRHRPAGRTEVNARESA